MSTNLNLGPLAADLAQRARHQGIRGLVRQDPGAASTSIASATWRSSTAAARGCTCRQQADPGPESGLYLRVADIRAAYDTLSARGVHFTAAPHLVHRHADGTEEWLAHFNDPEGRPLAIMAQVKP